MKTTPVPTVQRKIYTDEFRNNALQQLTNGPNIAIVALELGIASATLLRWKRQAEGSVGPTKEHFDAEFRERALQKLDKGQSLRQVASAMGVSIPSLVQWKRQMARQEAVVSSPADEINRSPQYTNSFNGIIHPVQEYGQPLGLVTTTSGVVGVTIPRWKHQTDAQDTLSTSLDIPVSAYTDEDKVKALGLLKSGKSIAQVAFSLGIPKVLIRRWWSYQRVAEHQGRRVDGRRLYDDTFKAEALQQINSGVSIRQLAKSLGVTEVTLHKWRKQVPVMHEPVDTKLQRPAFIANEQASLKTIKADESITRRITRLEQQLRQVEQERDTLKMAIQILMRAS